MFEQLPEKLQNAFLDIYVDDIIANVDLADIDKKRRELLKEKEELMAQCKNSSGYAKTRARREALDIELQELNILATNISIHRIDGTAKLYNIIKDIYERNK